MIHRRRIAGQLLALALATSAPILAGCGSDGLGKRYSVSGQVSYKGTPVEKGEINFVPEDGANGRAAFGVIEGGSYSLTTLSDNDGAFAGKYKVTIRSKTVDYSAAEEAVKKKGMSFSVAMPQEYAAKANREAKSNVPSKYSIPSTSTLTAEVKEQSNQINFDLTD
jgi:hypothetical protein